MYPLDLHGGYNLVGWLFHGTSQKKKENAANSMSIMQRMIPLIGMRI